MNTSTLTDLGWSRHFQAQMTDTDASTHRPARIAALHRNGADALTEDGPCRLTLPPGIPMLTVGDWVLFEEDRVTRCLDRLSVLNRRAAGTDARDQLLAANVTTLGIVSSCNADFNVARIERYLVLAAEAGCLPLVILTKADTADDPRAYQKQAERLSPLLTAVTLDATDPADVERLAPWCRDGETLALLGSSGVGKTTLRNVLTGQEAATQSIREDDAKGRHTTTMRELVPTRFGGWLIDTPGMRELRLADVSDGIEAVFADIEELARECRFSDCAHETEPGCAVQNAIAAGALDPDRLRRWRKLRAEEVHNTESIAEARARARGFNKLVKGAMKAKRMDRGD